MLEIGDKDEPHLNMCEMLEIGDKPRDEPHLNMCEMLGIRDKQKDKLHLTSICIKCWE